MTKRKKDRKKTQADSGIAQAKAPIGQPVAPVQANQSEPPPRSGHKAEQTHRKQDNRQDAQSTGPRRLSMVTCCASMFLTFVLGIYLGTLVPGIIGTAEQPQVQKTTLLPEEATPEPQQQVDQQLRTAIADLEKRAAANPDSAPDWINLGNIYFDAHMPLDAIKAYERALVLAPRNADVLTDLGIMYRETGDFAKAVATFHKAIEVDPGHQNAMFNEGVVLANDLHKNDEAIAAWQRLLDINPGAMSPTGVPLAEMFKRLR